MKTKWVPAWVIPAVVLLAVATVWLRLHIVRVAYEIDQADRMTAGLQQAREQAELKLANLRSPRRLEILARARFHMSQPQPSQVIPMHQAAPKRFE